MDDPTSTTYTVGEVARMCHLSRATIHRAVQSGRLPYSFRTPGGHYRIGKWAVQEFIMKYENPGDNQIVVSTPGLGV